MEELNYYDLDSLLNKCVTGEISMTEPIEVTNKLKNQRIEISLLKHFLILCRTDKQSLIRLLSTIRFQIKQYLLSLFQSNQYIRDYIENVICEWSLDITPEDLLSDGLDQCDYSEGDDLLDYETLLTEKQNIQEGGRRLQTLEEALQERQLSYTPLTQDYAQQIKDKVKSLHTECDDCMGRIKEQTSMAMSRHKLLDPRHKDILLDLSTKSKSTYLEYLRRMYTNDNTPLAVFISDIQQNDVPDYIHTTFLNYIITLTMLKKEMAYISNTFKGLLTTIQPRMDRLGKFTHGVNEIDALVVDTTKSNDTTPESKDTTSGSILGFSFF